MWMPVRTAAQESGVGVEPNRAAVRLARRRFRGAIGALGIVAIFAAWIGWHIGGTTSVKVFDDVVTSLAAFAAAVMCLRAGLTHDARLRRFWLLLAAASAAWTIAEVIWAIYDLVLNVPVPVPSWADVGYLSAIPLTVAALVSHPAMYQKRQAKTRATLDGIILATSLLFLSWSFVLGPLWRHSDLTSLGGIVAVAYPFGDIVMLLLVVLVIRAMKTGDRFALWSVLGGIVAMALADSTYTYLTEIGKYATGNLVDIGWVAGYLGLALGGFASSGEEVVEQAPVSPASSMASIVVPFVPVLVALAASALEVALGRKLPFSDWLMALVLVLLVLSRQALMLLDGFGLVGAVGPVSPQPDSQMAEEVPRA
jgi:hypothetical protein